LIRPPCTYGQPGKENHPLNCVNPAVAEQFCARAGKRLCTEAEWEKAARGGCEFHAGDCAAATPVCLGTAQDL
jgi:formylglycine-generating enzyme required for sulfatase activity